MKVDSASRALADRSGRAVSKRVASPFVVSQRTEMVFAGKKEMDTNGSVGFMDSGGVSSIFSQPAWPVRLQGARSMKYYRCISTIPSKN